MDFETKYLGELRTSATHMRSGTQIMTDAPVDNQGKGEAFSPTDLLSTSLASCMLTIMGIAARTHEIKMDGTRAEIKKIMASDPRRVAEVVVDFYFPTDIKFSEKDRKILEHAALNCPVAKSLHPELKQTISFHY